MNTLKSLSIATAGAGFIALATISAAQAASVAIGAPGDQDSGNCFPFGCDSQGDGPGTRYQQVYNRDLFPSSLGINFISFFNAQFRPGSIDTATYTIYLSSTTKPVNGLDTENFDSNVGADNSLFFKGVLGGPIGPTRIFSIAGNHFDYEPTNGNLLLDIFKSGGGGPDSVFLDARNGSFGTKSSRAHNFDGGFNSYGLVTEFGSERPTTVPVPEPSSALSTLAFGALGAGYILKRKLKIQKNSGF